MPVTATWTGDELIARIRVGVGRGLLVTSTDWHAAWEAEWTPEEHPYMTGRERDEGYAVVDDQGDHIRLTVGSTVPYAIFEELGTSRQEAHHPLLKSVDQATSPTLQNIAEAIAEEIPGATAHLSAVAGFSKFRSKGGSS